MAWAPVSGKAGEWMKEPEPQPDAVIPWQLTQSVLKPFAAWSGSRVAS
ncbi:MAG: hypothetical protein IPM94_05920 [bacterium]|nr:hypothetical protein [bacterium]